MTEMQRYSRYCEYKAGLSNKFYEVSVEEREDGKAIVHFTFGRIGTVGRELPQGQSANFRLGCSVADDHFATKLRKGYVEVTAMQAIASAVEDVTERAVNGRPSIVIPVPDFGAGKSAERCRLFCEKWLAKFNLVHRSSHELRDGSLDQQFQRVLVGYCREWERIKQSKTHKDNLGAQADEAFKSFFDALMSKTGFYTHPHGFYPGIGVR